MNFKKFNGTTWETVQHKVYGSGTDSLTAFPAMIQASGDPLTDYTIYGNTVQDGTPTPEAPVDVVGCGDWDETHQSYKLTPTVTGTEHPIYLGQVESTRKIKKAVFKGDETENWGYSSSGNNARVYLAVDSMAESPSISTHYKFGAIRLYPSLNKYCINSASALVIGVDINSITSATDFKTYLQQQYAAGTPVTVWYVLAEPETGIVNEPLMKIGDYADTITMAQAEVTIPTSDGDNTISFSTTVQPSAMSAAFKGWHPVQAAKQYDGNDWN